MLKWILLAAVVAVVAYGAKFALDRRSHKRRRAVRDGHREKTRATWDAMMELKDHTPREPKP